ILCREEMMLAGRRIRPVVLTLAVLATSAAALLGEQEGKAPEFEKGILPILTAHCFKCHGISQPKAKLDLRTPAGMLKGGESGPALVPGASARSLLYEMVRKGDMPPDKNKLAPEQVARIRHW